MEVKARQVARLSDRLVMGTVRFQVPLEETPVLSELAVAARALEASRQPTARRMIDIRTASRKTGIGRRRLQLLARRGIVEAEKVDRRWFLEWNSLMSFLASE